MVPEQEQASLRKLYIIGCSNYTGMYFSAGDLTGNSLDNTNYYIKFCLLFLLFNYVLRNVVIFDILLLRWII